MYVNLPLKTYSETDDPHNDHSENVWPGDFDPLAERGPFVEHAIAVCAAARLLATLEIRHYAAATVTFLSDSSGSICIYWLTAATKEPHFGAWYRMLRCAENEKAGVGVMYW